MENFKNESSLYVDPNAYIFGVKKEQKKIVFSEPYECLPSYYANNNFKKSKCDCISKPKPKPKECDCGKPCNHKNEKSGGFDFKGLMPILGLLGGGGMDLSKIISVLGNNQAGDNPIELISSLMQNGGKLGNIMNLFKPKKARSSNSIKSTDVEIINYTKVE